MKRHAAPIIAAILLLLPLLYVGSYCVLVDPLASSTVGGAELFERVKTGGLDYRALGNYAPHIFWPLEQIDREVRPGVWQIAEPTGTDLQP